jgi:signal transduction histidine kinase
MSTHTSFLSRLSLDSPTPLMKQVPTMAAFVLALVLLPFEAQVITAELRVAVAIALAALASALAAALPWSKINPRWMILVPVLSLLAAGAFRTGTGGSTSPFGALILLPFVWIASEPGRFNAIVAGVSVFVVLLLPLLVTGMVVAPGDVVRVIFSPIIYSAVGLVINEIANRVRLQLEEARASALERAELLEQMVEASAAQKLNEARLKSANRLIQSIWKAVTEQSVIGSDLDGLIDVWNPGAEKMLGLTESQVFARKAHVIDFHLASELDERIRGIDTRHHTLSSPGRFSALVDAVRGGAADIRDWTYVRPDGKEVPVQVAATPRIDESGDRVGFIFVATDMTQAREFARLKDQFVGLISHELRTPLSSILGYLELMRDDEDDPLSDEQLRYLAVAERNAHRLLRLVGDLLFTAQVEAGQFPLDLQEIDLASVVKGSIETAEPIAAGADVAVSCEIEDENLFVRGDAQRLGQAIDNLVSNAIKFTPAQGRVTVYAGRDADDVLITVSDTGIGIPATELSQLSTRFFRASTATRNAVPGVGLGLTITKAIVSAHGGTLGIESTEGVGTSFSIRLPIVVPAMPLPEGSGAMS